MLCGARVAQGVMVGRIGCLYTVCARSFAVFHVFHIAGTGVMTDSLTFVRVIV